MVLENSVHVSSVNCTQASSTPQGSLSLNGILQELLNSVARAQGLRVADVVSSLIQGHKVIAHFKNTCGIQLRKSFASLDGNSMYSPF